MQERGRNGAAGHLVRGLASSTRHNALAYGYSLATTGSFGALVVLDETPRVWEILLFGAGGALTYTLATAGVTRGFRVGEQEEPRIVQALGASFGFLSVTGGIGAAALVGWAASGWIPWLVGPFAASSVYLLLSALEFVVARRISETAELELQEADT